LKTGAAAGIEFPYDSLHVEFDIRAAAWPSTIIA
jgi:hypothetical protein